MSALKISNRKKQLIEKLGVMYEQSGLAPAPSRILALLLISDRVELSFDEIRDTLNLSKSATSNGLNLLINASRIEYITFPGDRKRYFRSKVNQWQDGITKTLESLASFSTLFKEILLERTVTTKEFNLQLSQAISFMDFMKDEMPKLVKKWEALKD